ncbi:hypothetical protein Pstr01_18990 [Pseudomonas straminea]|uniref:Uncharacterized protein n=1 Tax=Pseudomonas straminea TaxID=47882 RepID=A0A1I1V855_PSEOC|nr:hypothetical protein [Pseudomonas straminea]GLX13660.1 hypothetical protein Pstr01_18990 [Pseudomonas straminea]SFD79176.1 hypothetical protein SAMN05216372_104146 [Pseudomonas straminea]
MDKRSFAIALTLISLQVLAAEPDNQQMLDTEISNTQLSSPTSCTLNNGNNVDAIKAKFTEVISSEKSKIEQEAKAIKDDMPELNPGEAAIQVDFTFRDEQMELIFDLPSVTMVDTPMSMDFPEVTMKTQTWSWDVPQTTMELQCTPGVPETVVEGGTCEAFGISFSCPKVTIRPGKDICLHVPVITMARQEAKLDVPEFTMKRQDWVIGVPETRMERQRVVFNYPALVVTDVKATSADMEKRSQELTQRSKNTFAGISTAMKSEITLASMQNINKSFNCQKKQLAAQVRKAYDDLNALSAGAQASVDRARAMKATPEILSTLGASSEKLKEAKKSLLTQYAKARRDIEAKRKEVLVKMSDSLGEQQHVAAVTQ